MTSSSGIFCDFAHDVGAHRLVVARNPHPGATHDFDEPTSRRQSALGNQAVMDDALVKAIAIVGR